MQIISYNGTKEEYDRIVEEKTLQGFSLTNVANIKEGNFLGFKECTEQQSYIPVDSEFVLRLEAIEAKLDEVLKAVKK